MGHFDRLFLHTGATRIAQITEQDVAEFSKVIEQFKERSDLLQFYESKEQYDMLAKRYQSGLYLLHVLLYHRGQARLEPRKRLPYAEKEVVMQLEKPHLRKACYEEVSHCCPQHVVDADSPRQIPALSQVLFVDASVVVLSHNKYIVYVYSQPKIDVQASSEGLKLRQDEWELWEKSQSRISTA